ncbi:hypothetical protein DCCM_0494 [Desulfocucumis palustris]|uniref:Uncharacterized protein n=1 Tax=Desulfocucumis palustris TaxID=1898651 RepID=A0A2L2X8F2_9FIRM|nr:hypothetical protein DCCM_0494 [Desulfocucumis palustris]
MRPYKCYISLLNWLLLYPPTAWELIEKTRDYLKRAKDVVKCLKQQLE